MQPAAFKYWIAQFLLLSKLHQKKKKNNTLIDCFPVFASGLLLFLSCLVSKLAAHTQLVRLRVHKLVPQSVRTPFAIWPCQDDAKRYTH